MTRKITSPQDSSLTELCQRLGQLGQSLEKENRPTEQLRLCGQYGVYEWFTEGVWGGQGWSRTDLAEGYLALSRACLSTAFVLTQRSGACRRLETSDNSVLKARLLPQLVAGECFATVGVSHLTTSRRHLDPVLRAEETAAGFVLNGYSPWVTGASFADIVVLGATLADGRQLLVALPTDLPGVSIPPAIQLVGLSASQTGPVQCSQVEVGRELLIAGPVDGVMQQGGGAGTGGLETSFLAVGLAGAAIDFVDGESEKRPELGLPAAALEQEWTALRTLLLAAAAGATEHSGEALRIMANSLVLRSTQAALAAAKGSGYAAGHPVGRWCREALFFLVWSCPQAVMAANLAELAQLN